ncbi:MAG: amidohydrolase family protein [Propionibacteriaceae bacterium]|jgi:imidazolonepropionase-like amidohydrolase|nr:amidohydrolase family protein [Propionibacteriaceae bacterium]
MSELLVANARVFGAGKEPVNVYARDGVVVSVGGEVPSSAPVLDAWGGTLIPGLLDAHCHAYGSSMSLEELEKSPMSWIALKAAQRLSRALSRGFTTVRDVAGGDPGLAKAIACGLFPAPRYLYTGPALSQTGGHGDGRHPLYDDPPYCGCNTNVVDGVDAMRVRVRELLSKGAHAIKLLTSGGVISPTDPIEVPQYSAAEIQVAAEEAERRGTYVTAHAYSPRAITHSVKNGVRCIEHGNLLDAPTAALMAETGTYLVPTLAAYDAMDRRGDDVGLTPVGREKNTQVLVAGQEAIRLARAAGVRIGFGTDLMGDLEDEQLQGLRLQAEVEGLERTLEAATVTNAALMGLTNVGRVEPGYAADMVIFRGDLAKDPELLWNGARTVIQAGQVVVA